MVDGDSTKSHGIAQPEKSWVEAAALGKLNQEISETGAVEKNEVLVVFPVGRERYALPIEKVREVVKAPKIAPVPQAPDYILGVGNVRGNVLAVIDLEKRINPKAPAMEGLEEAFIIVIKDDTYQAGLIVRQVPDTLLVQSSQINTSAAVINNLAPEDHFIKGIVKKDKSMIILVDILEMIEVKTE
ncbi:chemotaxis protein CheW [Marinoscillum luteum]|uniref:Chemotaxis protein CheW n=1 Tax=Marinoscillum luteum TaxID=861051 RepID=A0ABW7NA98_9BACT